jgi:hypothetical protein
MAHLNVFCTYKNFKKNLVAKRLKMRKIPVKIYRHITLTSGMMNQSGRVRLWTKRKIFPQLLEFCACFQSCAEHERRLIAFCPYSFRNCANELKGRKEKQRVLLH